MVAQMSLQPLWAQQLTHSDAIRRASISGREIILTYEFHGMLKSRMFSQACKALRPIVLIDLCILVTCWHMRISYKLLTRPAYANPRRYAGHKLTTDVYNFSNVDQKTVPFNLTVMLIHATMID